MTGSVFTVVAVLDPTPKEIEDGKVGTIIMEPRTIVARDGQKAAQQILITEGANWGAAGLDVDRIDVVVRPF